ncbi:MAG: peptidase, partial [Verrucomicrobiota bacterium]
DLPLDFSAEAPKSSGGFIRDYDAPEIVRVAAPVYLKSGGYEMATHAFQADYTSVKAYVRRMELVKRAVEVYCPEGVCSGAAPDDMAIPEV